MRLIGTFPNEKKAYALYCVLLEQGIENLYESAMDSHSNQRVYHVWVYEEERMEESFAILKEYQENPEAEKFQIPLPKAAPPAYKDISQKEDLKWQSAPLPPQRRPRFSWGILHIVFLLCFLLFFWDTQEEKHIADTKGPLAAQIALTPLQQTLLFDDPHSYSYIKKLIETVPIKEARAFRDVPPEALELLHQEKLTPVWGGLYDFIEIAKEDGLSKARQIPLFEKIRQGELWRLFTPCLLHRNLFHILFNMLWAWMLIKQLDARLSKWQVSLLIVLIGCVSNVAQYIVGGPFFLGFSGVVVGLAGFIWQRQRTAPWEGYPLQRSTVSFLFFFVLMLCAVQVFSFFLHMIVPFFHFPRVGNAAHVVGGLTGLLLGKCPFFSRRG